MEVLNATELRDKLSSLGVEIYAENGRLRVSAPKGTLTEELQKAVSASKVQLLELLDHSVSSIASKEARLVARGDTPPLHIESVLAEIWKDLFGIDEILKDDDFFELGGHSLLGLRMMAMVEAKLGRRVDLATLFEAPTIRSFASAIECAEKQFDFRKVVRLQPHGTRPQIFGISSTGAYYLLARKLGPEWPLTALQLYDPSFPRDRMPKTIEEIASQYVQLIRQLQPEGPYHLLGWCAGGILTVEIAHQLGSANEKVPFVGLIEAYAPVQYKRFGWLKSRLARNSFRLKWNLAEFKKVLDGDLAPTEFLTNRQTLKKAAGVIGRPQDSELDTAEVAFERWIMTEYLVSAAERYRINTFPGRLRLFRATKMPKGLFLDGLNGWGAYAAGGVDLTFVDGDHHSIFRPPGVDQLAKAISAALSELPESGIARSGEDLTPAALGKPE